MTPAEALQQEIATRRLSSAVAFAGLKDTLGALYDYIGQLESRERDMRTLATIILDKHFGKDAIPDDQFRVLARLAGRPVHDAEVTT